MTLFVEWLGFLVPLAVAVSFYVRWRRFDLMLIVAALVYGVLQAGIWALLVLPITRPEGTIVRAEAERAAAFWHFSSGLVLTLFVAAFSIWRAKRFDRFPRGKKKTA